MLCGQISRFYVLQKFVILCAVNSTENSILIEEDDLLNNLLF